MLVLTCKDGEYVLIDGKTKVIVKQSKTGRVSLGFEAPEEVRIVRGKLIEKEKEEEEYQKKLVSKRGYISKDGDYFFVPMKGDRKRYKLPESAVLKLGLEFKNHGLVELFFTSEGEPSWKFVSWIREAA